MTIQEFVQDTEANWKQAYRNRPASEVLLGPMKKINWRETFFSKGYIPIRLGDGNHGHWKSVHNWCQENFGRSHYSWTGEIFWFENEKDATLFSLRWG